jgi:hypothetical protein
MPRLAVIQSAATLTKVPWRTIIGAGARTAGPATITSYSHVGYEWSWGPEGNPSATWSSAEIMVGRRVQALCSATAVTFGAADQIGFAELNGIKGEVLWAKIGNANSATTLTTIAPVPAWYEQGLLFVAYASARTTAGAPSGVHSGGLTPIVDISQSASRFLIFRYVPGTRPTVAWTWPASNNHGVVTAIVR